MDWELFVLNAFVFFEFVFFKKINDRVAAALEKAIWRGKTFKPYLGAGWRHALAVFLGILAGIPVLFTKGLACVIMSSEKRLRQCDQSKCG